MDHEPTPKEIQLLEKFKQRIQDIVKPQHDDYFLRKWLIARQWDLNKAEQMYRNSMGYKEKMKVDTLLEHYKWPEVLTKHMAGGFCGHDKAGSPIKVELFGFLDMKGLMYSAKRTDFEKMKLWECQHIYSEYRRMSEKLNTRVDGLFIIFDMDKVGARNLWRPGLNMYLHLVEVLEDNYPEMTKGLFVVNAPMIFPIIWKMVRHLVTESMKTRIHVLGSDFRSVLLKHIDPDQLPTYLGGTRTDPDGNPRCVTEICQGGQVPRHYYLSEMTEDDDSCEAIVPKGEKLKLEFYVDKPDSLLRWEFRTVEYDIGFCVTYKRDSSDKKSKEKEVYPSKRFNSHQVAEDDSIICEDIGTYAVIFDNSYSWTKSKTLFYLVELHTTSNKHMESEIDFMSTGGNWTRLYKDMQITHL